MPLQATKVVAGGWLTYLSGAVARRDTPFDVASDLVDWVKIGAGYRKPEWAHEHEVVRTWPVARLLDYSSDPDADIIPTLVLPAQAGHASTVVDYDKGQSQMITLRDSGLTRLFTLDWLPATRETTQFDIEDYLKIVEESIADLGGKVNLVGDCQGGWLAVIYAALHPEQINTLTVAGAPIDTHVGDTKVQKLSRTVSPAIQERLYKTIVKMEGGIHRGQSQLAFFKVLEPLNTVERDMALLTHLDDDEFVRRHTKFLDWFEWTQDVPAAFYLWAVNHLFVRNELAKGTLTIGDDKVDLAAITCPVFLLTGKRDHITPAPQVLALGELVGTPADQIRHDEADAGHLGIFMGRDSLQNHWAPFMRIVAELSRTDQDASAGPSAEAAG